MIAKFTGKLLGMGTYGTVKECYKYGNTYALKIIPKKNLYCTDEVNAIKNEIKINKLLNHPNICKYYASDEDNENYYIMMEKLGSSLRDKINSYHKFTNQEIITIIKYINEGLHYLHENNIVYRDLKPDNILFDNEGKVKLCDFGTSHNENEIINNISGTYGYIAPEIYDTKKYTSSSDYWNLGVIIYEMIYHQQPSPMYQDLFKEKEYAFYKNPFHELIYRLIDNNPQKRFTYYDVNNYIDNVKLSI